MLVIVASALFVPSPRVSFPALVASTLANTLVASLFVSARVPLFAPENATDNPPAPLIVPVIFVVVDAFALFIVIFPAVVVTTLPTS